jgi:large subunit ribosomal protein L23Ae
MLRCVHGECRLLTMNSPKTLELSRAPKYPRKSVPHEPRMDASKVLIHPLNTESAMKKVRLKNIPEGTYRG